MRLTILRNAFSLCLIFGAFDVPLVLPEQLKNPKPVMAVANYPLRYFTERIASDHVQTVFPIPQSIDPAFWNPQPQGVLLYQSADVILLNGATYSKWLDKVTLPKRKFVNTSHAFKDHYISLQEPTTHRHGPQGEHAHSGLAFTTWIDFQQAIQQANAIYETLVKLSPDSEQMFQTNFSSLKNDLLELDLKLQKIAKRNNTQPLLASHPIYHYFARRYNLNIESLLWEPEDVPDKQQWEEFERLLTHHAAKWMIWEDTPTTQTIDRLQSYGIGTLVFNPVANVPSEGDFLTTMHLNLENLKLAFP